MTGPTELDPNVLDPTGELAAAIEAQRVEYGTYVASSPIYAGTALAYAVGHPVPCSNVVKHGYWLNGQVALVDGAAHAPEIAAHLEPAPVDDEAEADEADTDEEGK